MVPGVYRGKGKVVGCKHTCRRRDNGIHSLKALSDMNVEKKAGQLEAVKLLPRLESKGLGKADVCDVDEADDVPVALDLVVVDDDDDAALFDRLINRTCGSGGGLRS